MISPPIPRGFRITAFVLLALLWRISAQDVNTVFKVASGNEPGSCDQYLGSLNAQFTEALAMSAAGFAAIQKVRAKTVSYPERLILYSMFGLNVGNYVSGGEWEPGDDIRIGYITAIFRAASSAATLSGITPRPKLYCGSTFLKWTTKAIDPDTGETTDQPIPAYVGTSTGAYWYDEVKAYVKDNPPKTSANTICEGETQGFTLKDQNAIGLCPSLFSSDWKASLQSYKANQLTIHAGDELYAGYRSVPGAFLHEITHLVSKGDIEDKQEYDEDGNIVPNGVSYGFQSCFNLALKPDESGPPFGKDLALRNADSYHLYALASYLDEWDWSEGRARDPASIPPPSP